ncbi:fam-g protein [Plasmodium gallinaceum]|uniref:Fam-g protein n=1 Tax=Plasmodium gallinaceum TaxID=5849 RepID=A0A1J1GU17_PLAGA|nr:fam-g protein [Plasmodium gallinaceum]CRG96022.1 fam-g protein [Plasmodium gallinaceum]
MKTFTLYLKIFTFLLLIWIFHCFYNYDSNKSLINRDILQTKIGLKHKRMLADGDKSEKKSSYIKKRVEYYPSGDMEIELYELVHLMDMYFKFYNANILSRYVEEVLFKKENEMRYKCRDKILNAYRKNISVERVLESFNCLISVVLQT